MKSETRKQVKTASLLAAAGAILVAALFLTVIRDGNAAKIEGAITPEPVALEEAPPRIEVVFALDTTGSMSGLIGGAKQKIWSIANKIVSGQPQPEVRIGLIGYRDITDAYVTKFVPLSKDVDAVYEDLMAFSAAGGGDGPEHVNQALYEAIHKTDWSTDQEVLKIIFLVGDAPPHNDYDDGLNSSELAKIAAAKGIVINTIRVGSDMNTESEWKRIASAGGGQYATISQSGGMVAVKTPYDRRLEALNAELAGTIAGYGSFADKGRLSRKARTRAAMKGEVAASAASFSGKTGGSFGRGDLLSDLEGGEVALADIPAEALPEPMQKMDADARRGWVKRNSKKRKAIQAKIIEESKSRDEWIAKEGEKTPGRTSFDDNVVDMLRTQAKEVGVKY